MSDTQPTDDVLELIVPLVEPLIERQEKVEQGLAAQETVLVELTNQLERLTNIRPEQEVAPWNLYTANPKQISELLTEINQWLPWMNATYGAGQSTNMIPTCWFLHPNVVAHVVGLYTSWTAANYGSETPNSDLVYWNLRCLPDVLDIVNAPADKGGMAGCRREHRTPERMDPVPEALQDDFAQWLAEAYPLEKPDDSKEPDLEPGPVGEPQQ
ncbi:hypothetical protein M2368_003636 [Arthrobacter sp. JUb119]|uniref:hypothetical protein n=1 Tax=Glutamicibacter sp. NPDC087661 TaxID=3363996 RepID=UPI000F981426|nr:hypothetical protein [Arthrobacter sp. JUb119]